MLLQSKSPPSLLFPSTMQMGPPLAQLTCCTWVRMDQHLPLNSFLVHLIFLRALLLSVSLVIIACAFLSSLPPSAPLQIDQSRFAVQRASTFRQCFSRSAFSNLCREVQESRYVEWAKLFSHIYDAGIRAGLPHRRADHFWSAHLQGYHDSSIW